MMKRKTPTTSSSSEKKVKKNQEPSKNLPKNDVPCWLCLNPVADPCYKCINGADSIFCPNRSCSHCKRVFHLHCYELTQRLKKHIARANRSCPICDVIISEAEY